MIRPGTVIDVDVPYRTPVAILHCPHCRRYVPHHFLERKARHNKFRDLIDYALMYACADCGHSRVWGREEA